MENLFCVEALEGALRRGQPEIFNTDQGAQFTSEAFTGVLLAKEIAISMDGRGRALDNAIIERLWWTVKYENVYPKDYADGHELYRGLENYFEYYNNERKHSSWTTSRRLRYSSVKQERDESERGDAVATLPPRPLRAAPAGTDCTAQRHQEQVAARPSQHGAGTWQVPP